MKKQYQTCVSCRFRRCKCGPDCAMAPFFPAHMDQQFRNAHKVFGISHLTKLLRSVHPNMRCTAMKNAIAEAGNRVADLVGGSYEIIRNLEVQIDEEQEELLNVNNALDALRGGRQGNNNNNKNMFARDDDVLQFGDMLFQG